MYYQKQRDRLKNVGNKSLQMTEYSQTREFPGGGIGKPLFKYTGKNQRLKTQHKYEKPNTDSLQIFQQQLNSVLSGTRINKPARKSSRYQEKMINYPSKETLQIKNQVKQIKNMLQSQKQIKQMEGKLQKLIIQLEQQKTKRNTQTQRTQQNPISNNFMSIPQTPVYLQQPQMMYSLPPSYYYHPPPPPYYPYYDTYRHKPRRRRRHDDYSSQQQQMSRKSESKGIRNTRKSNPYSKTTGNRRQSIKTRLRIIIFTVAYTIFLRNQAKKLSVLRKSNLKKFWVEKFESQINNIKNWLLDAQKYSLSIILQKKNLNFKFFDDISQRIRQQKTKLIMQIVSIGVNKLAQDSTPQKISLFSQLVLNLCRRGSFAINRFWTAQEMQQICISQFYGFFRIDANLEKFLIGLLVFIKVFIFNMFLQPSKFDIKNFPKKQQPITTNMKLISSVYYHMVKQVINQYKNENRDSSIYKIGNWLKVKKQFIVQCSQPIIYGKGYPEEDQYISGLFKQDQIIQLKDSEAWTNSVQKIKSIIEKIHTQMINKGRMVKKNLKYKLYN